MVSVDVRQHVYLLTSVWFGLAMARIAPQRRALERVLRPHLYKRSKVDTDTAELRSCVKVKVDVLGSRP